MSEMKLVSLKCPNCSGKLDIGLSIETFACGYCGANVAVERGGNIVALRLLTDAMMGVQRGTDRTAAELAIRRLTDEIVALQREKDQRNAEHQKLKLKWSSVTENIGPSDAVLPLMFVGLIVFIPVMTLLSMFNWMNTTVAAVISATATFAVALYVWRAIDMRPKNGVAEKREMLERETEPVAAALSDIQRRLETAKVKLQAQRQLVES